MQTVRRSVARGAGRALHKVPLEECQEITGRARLSKLADYPNGGQLFINAHLAGLKQDEPAPKERTAIQFGAPHD